MKQVGDSSLEAHPVKQNNPLPVLCSPGGAFGRGSVWTGLSRAGTRRGLPEATQHTQAHLLTLTCTFTEWLSLHCTVIARPFVAVTLGDDEGTS